MKLVKCLKCDLAFPLGSDEAYEHQQKHLWDLAFTHGFKGFSEPYDE